MSQHDEVPPMLCRWLLWVAGRLAPPALRAEFRKRWDSRLVGLCILLDRGEVAGVDGAALNVLCRDAVSSAFWLRFSRAGLLRFALGPQFVAAFGVTSAVLLALVSRGFQTTRSIVRAAIYWNVEPLDFFIGDRFVRYVPPRGEIVVAAAVPIVIALGIGATLFIIGRLSVGRYGWRYWLLLAGKLAAVIALVPLTWVEGSRFLWNLMTLEVLRVWVVGIGSTLAFLGGFGLAVIWVFDDQRRRCPECLRRLARPVTMGSWGSMFEPVTTEFVCDEGHGALSLAENEMSEGDRWVSLDASWREL